MAISNATLIQTNVQSTPSTTISITIPNDSSVAVGDWIFIILACASNNRNFNISGGDGGWTDFGFANSAVLGHKSQVWAKLCTAGDLGAAITLTVDPGSPTPTALKLIMSMGKVVGVDPSDPIFDYFANSSVSSSTTKTTPQLESVPANSREISIACNSNNSTPNVSSWTPPSGITERTEGHTTATSGANSMAWGDSTATVSGIIGNRSWTADVSGIGSSWTIALNEEPEEPVTGFEGWGIPL